MTAAEIVRSAVYQWVYGQAPGVDEGYAAARSLATRLAHEAVDRGLAMLPSNPDEVAAFISEGVDRDALHRRLAPQGKSHR